MSRLRPEAEEREFRVDIYEHLAGLFGGVNIPEDVATCPSCGGRIRVLAHGPGAAYCPNRQCGWHLPRLVGEEVSA